MKDIIEKKCILKDLSCPWCGEKGKLKQYKKYNGGTDIPSIIPTSNYIICDSCEYESSFSNLVIHLLLSKMVG